MNSKYEQTQNTKEFRSPRLQGAVYCNLVHVFTFPSHTKYVKRENIIIVRKEMFPLDEVQNCTKI